MADTVRTLSALQTLFANNTTHDITAQALRDFLVSVLGVLAYSAKTADYTLNSNDCLVTCDATAASLAITLPAASAVPGRVFNILKITAANIVTITGTVSGQVNPTISTQYTCATVFSDGSNWYFI